MALLLARLLLLPLLLFPLRPQSTAADWRWPVGPPAEVLRPFDPPGQRWLPGHLGVDLAAEPGQEVRAAGSGRVRFAGTVAGTPVVSVSHGELRTTYLPVESGLVRGDPVTAGDPLGTLAAGPVHCRGRPCLHWGLLRGADYLDPLSLFGLGEFRLLPLRRSTRPETAEAGEPGPGRATEAGVESSGSEETRERRSPGSPGSDQARGWALR
ncbi:MULTISPECIES: murein hydrolase activator EnvC [unclassified Nocardiopsis]|uniref:murein hydrolase activator EnvC family protein n=1 Tax=unclassified Nocardiopsis TaxID=2649073 RepID=UPI0009F8DDFF|nr:M23 family metallopeptidase [Nocardiopsis sp. TSRI0078]